MSAQVNQVDLMPATIKQVQQTNSIIQADCSIFKFYTKSSKLLPLYYQPCTPAVHFNQLLHITSQLQQTA